MKIEEEIKDWLEETTLSKKSKEKLLEESLEIYGEIGDLPYLKEDKASISLFLEGKILKKI